MPEPGTDRDDLAGAATPEVRNRRSRAVVGAEEIGFEGVAPRFRVTVLDWPWAQVDAGVDHHEIEATELAVRAVEGAVHRVAVANVRRNGDGAAPGLLDLRSDALDLSQRPRHAADGSATSCVREGDYPADPSPGSRDERNLALEATAHLGLLSASTLDGRVGLVKQPASRPGAAGGVQSPSGGPWNRKIAEEQDVQLDEQHLVPSHARGERLLGRQLGLEQAGQGRLGPAHGAHH